MESFSETEKSIEDLAVASTSTQMVCYSSTSNPRWSHDVFLSFRGADTRYNFTNHLYTSLVERGINTFKDDDNLIRRGEEITPKLLKAVKESRSSIVVFSETYADSRWCLDELATIMECRREFGQLVFPIFYRVDPSDVRKQSGSFEEAFANYEENWKDKLERWRAALTEAANLSGGHLLQGYESKRIKEIIDRIVKRLNPKLLPVEEHIVGMDFRLNELKSLLNVHLDDIRMVGIYGPSGIGKTTTAKMVYNDILCQFNGGIFLEDVKSRSGFQLVQELLRGILAGKNVELNSINDGINMIKGRLGSKKVFVVIDDVDDSKQVKSLVKSCKWFGRGSRIILTTKNKHLLDVYGVDESYEAKVLCNEEAIQLFSWHAFKQNTPKEDYVDMSNRMVNYVQRFPLAIKVLGSFLYGMTIDEWKSTLGKLTKEGQEIDNVLEISYDGLDDNEKEILLDIACFYKGEDKDFALRILKSCSFYAEIGVRVLCDRCLISISNNMMSMHDLIQQMGWTVVRGKSREDPSKWSRLWDPDNIRHAFLGEKGSKNVEVISCDLSRSKEIQWNTKVFTKMKKLRLLKLHWSDHCGKVVLPPNFEFPSQELRYLHWEGYPLKTLPSNFHGENLVELHLRKSNIKQLWKRSKGLEKLKVIDLSYSKQLTKGPKFLGMPNVERLNLEGCTSLCKLHSSIGALNKLTYLNLGGCEKLQSLPSSMKFESLEVLHLNGCRNFTNFLEVHENMEQLKELYLDKSGIEELPSSIGSLTSLEILDLSECSNFKKFPEIHGNMKILRELRLNGTEIKELPSSIGDLTSLEILKLSKCSNFEELPSSIGSLTSLEILDLWGCSNFKKFPEIHGNMKILRKLHLNGTKIKELPSSIGDLTSLKILGLSECSNLEELPSNIGSLTSLEILDLSECSNLEELPSSIGSLTSLKILDLSECSNFKELPSSIGSLTSLKILDLSECSNFKKFPEIHGNMKILRELRLNGTKIIELPSSIEDLTSLKILGLSECSNLEELPSNIGSLTSLEILDLSECSNLEELPSSIGSLTSLKILDLSECSNFKELPSSIGSLTSLKILDLSECSNFKKFPEIHGNMKILRELRLNGTKIIELPSSIGSLTSLKILDLSECSNFKKFPEIHGNMKILRELRLNGTKIIELPSSIADLTSLKILGLSECSNFRKLPSSIGSLTSLEILDLSECSNFEELPSSIGSLTSLEILDLSECSNFEELPSSIGNLTCLTTLVVRNCSKLHSLPDNLRSLQCCLTTLDLGGCNLMGGGIPRDIWCLSSLEFLDVSKNHIRCIPVGIIQLLKLTTLRMNHCLMLEEIPELPSSLRRIEAHGCQHLETLSSPIHVLWSSLLNCFKSLIQAHDSHDILVQNEEEDSYRQQDIDLALPTSSGNLDEEEDLYGGNSDEEDGPLGEIDVFPLGEIDVFIPGSSGIPEWVSHQNKGCEVRIELPMNWYEDNNFLGFALFFHLLPLDDDDDELVNRYIITQKCKLIISHDDQSEMVASSIFLDSFCEAYWISSNCVSSDPALRVTYVPHIAIPDHYRSSWWKNFKAHLDTPFVSCQCGKNRAFKVEGCGIHLICAQDHRQQKPQLVREKASSSHHDTEDHPQHKRSKHL